MSCLWEEIERVNLVYETYTKKKNQIETFLRFADSQKNFLEVLSNMSIPVEATEYYNDFEKINNSVVLYNAAIISIYGSYESFVDELITQYIHFLKNNKSSFSELNEKIRKKHLDKSAEFLTNENRFRNLQLNRKTVIDNLYSTVSKESLETLSEPLLLSHGGNLKTEQLKGFLIEFGIENVNEKLKKHVEIEEFCRANGLDADLIGENVFATLDKVVEERNKVAHGSVDSRISYKVLLDLYVPFMNAFCKGIKDLIISEMIEDFVKNSKIKEIGPILNLWKDNRVVGINSGNNIFKVGEPIYLYDGKKWYFYEFILELQNDRKSRTKIISKNKNITFRIGRRINHSYKIFVEEVKRK